MKLEDIDLRYGDGTPFPGGGTTIYSHVSDKGVARHWHIERLAARARFCPRIDAPVEEHMARVIYEKRGVEMHRLSRLTPEALLEPLLFVEMLGEFPHDPPVSHLLVDGNHRFLRAWLEGIPALPAIIIPRHVSDTCLILGIPDVKAHDLLTMHSNIK